ncbi:DNA ligase [Pseudomonas phage Nerthus]|uniref:DNA ligase n=1 Tax=Pseudomonas phage Nerthus TaxID=2163984 RepID=A0A2S1GMP7_9CAUD|nr:DNA ligase [Pseudomonas phage Nerthus]AWD90657.1 DNA ligase [Pseudomonas phage Nerthus]
MGARPNHRPQEKTVMKLKHWQEVNAKKLHKEVKFPLAGQVKKDGVYALIVVLMSGVFIYNRTGRKMTNVEHLEKELVNAIFPCGVYLAELCNDFCSLEVLSGIVNPNRTKPLDDDQQELTENLHLYLHDALTIDEFIHGYTERHYGQRHNTMARNLMITPPGRYTILPFVILHNEDEVEAYARKCIDAGEEGAVFKPATGWEAGHKGWRMMKWVREVNYDLRCVGIEEGTGKYANKVANLIFKWEGDTLVKAMLGKGWTHADAERLYHGFCTKPIGHVDNPVDKVYRVRGLSDSSKGVIRLPKVMEERHDKTTGDF